MKEICELVPLQKGNIKINVRGYLMLKDKALKNTFYCVCGKTKLENCKGRAITKFINGSHYLKKFSEHHHSPQASDSVVAKAIGQIKKQAFETSYKPAQIIQILLLIF
ncbi:3752_t:CDS:1 [Funneliformis geosporum]|nr:3752_t:CDS:1 [Funneliformis geosporum]